MKAGASSGPGSLLRLSTFMDLKLAVMSNRWFSMGFLFLNIMWLKATEFRGKKFKSEIQINSGIKHLSARAGVVKVVWENLRLSAVALRLHAIKYPYI